jgi:peptidoglycan/LPS O-acetylase OafA/YrhL
VKTHFKGLNALRFYAALSVLVQHIAHSPYDWFKVPVLPTTLERLFIHGTDGVRLFFVLSGFLITYLLLTERERSGTVAVGKFYLRRILRIWPLYFLILALVGFGMPLLLPEMANPIARPGLAGLMVFFLGNLAYVLYYPFPPLEHLWSIAVEEQFYLVAPHLTRLIRNPTRALVSFIVVWWILLALSPTLPGIVGDLLMTMRYDCIALGGLFACIYYYRLPVLKWLQHPLAGILTVISFVVMAVFVAPTDELLYTILGSIVFGMLILNVGTTERFLPMLNHPTLEALGNLSYGMYMYHPLILLLGFHLLYSRLDTATYQLVIYPAIIGATVFVSWVSYRYIESPFLRLRDKYKAQPAPGSTIAAQGLATTSQP